MKKQLTLPKAIAAIFTTTLAFVMLTPTMANDPAISFEDHTLCPGSEVSVEVYAENFNNIGEINLKIPVDSEKISPVYSVTNRHPDISGLNAFYNPRRGSLFNYLVCR